MKINKHGQVETADMVSLIFTFIILIFYILFIVLGSLVSGEIESVIDAETNIEAYNYYPNIINYLNTQIEYHGKNVSFYDIVIEYVESDLKDKDIRSFLKDNTLTIFENLKYCYYSEISENYVERQYRLYIWYNSDYTGKKAMFRNIKNDGALLVSYGLKGYPVPAEQKLTDKYSLYLTSYGFVEECELSYVR